MNFDLVEVGMFQGYMEFGWGFLVVSSAPNQYPNIQSALKVAVDFQEGRASQKLRRWYRHNIQGEHRYK
jgi:hypothetical protein